MALRAVIYTRSATNQPRLDSIDNQIEVARRYIENQGWQLTGTYDDSAISGARGVTRPSFQRLMRDAESNAFDIVVVEDICRLSRDMTEVSQHHDQLASYRVKLHATQLGQVARLDNALTQTRTQLERSELPRQARRGQLNRIRSRKMPGGVTYGYDALPSFPGNREWHGHRINPEQAAIVVRIFRDFAAGKLTSAIAADLNKDGVSGPGGRRWSSAAIFGRVADGSGLLNNSMYVGQLTWNRHSYVQDPLTGKRIAHLNSADLHKVIAVPDLRIINDELWQRAKDRRAASLA